MSKKIIKRPLAKQDLIDLADYILQDNPEAALRFLDAAEETFLNLSKTPGMGSPREFKNADLRNIRMWPVKGFENHLIFYWETDSSIEIIRVLHAARDLKVVFESD